MARGFDPAKLAASGFGGGKRASRSRRPQKPPPGIFGPLGRADRPITRARDTATRRVERVTRRLPNPPRTVPAPTRRAVRAQERRITQAPPKGRERARLTHRGPASPRAKGAPTRQIISHDPSSGSLLGTAFGGALEALPGLNVIARTPLGRSLQGIAEATYHDPVGVPTKTAKGLVDAAVATPAAIAELAVKVGQPLFTGHPGQAGGALGDVGAALLKDLERRYGGSPGEISDRIRKEGAAPELLDFAAIASAGGAAAGRAVTAATRLAPESRAAQLLRAPRPDLRLSGNVVRPQTLSPNAFRALAQRFEDRSRARTFEKRTRTAARAEARGETAYGPALAPAEGANEVVPRSRRLAARAQRVDVSRIQSRAHLRQKRELREEVQKTAAPALHSLSKAEKAAAFHAVQGVIPVGGTAAQIRAAARARSRQLVGEREGRVVERALRKGGVSATGAHSARLAVRRAREQGAGPLTPEGLLADLQRAKAPRHVLEAVARSEDVLKETLKDPKVIRNHSELRALATIDKHADELASSRKLGDLHGKVLESSRRVEPGDPAFTGLQGLVRRYEPQGEALGLPNPVREARQDLERRLEDGTISPDDFKVANASVTKQAPKVLRRWVEQVQAKAKGSGLPEPAYVFHQAGVELRRGDLALGNTAKAIRGTKQTKLELFKTGRATARPEVVLQGLATNIKRRHQWEAVDETATRHAIPWSRGKNGLGMSVNDIYKQMREKGMDPDDFRIHNFGRVRKEGAQIGADELAGDDSALHELLVEGTIEPPRSAEEALAYGATKGMLLHKGVSDELLAQTKPAGAGTRIVSKFQGLQSAAILGLSPSWLGMQVAANTLATTFGTRGAIGDLAKAHPLYKRLSESDRRMLDELGGIGVMEAHAAPHLGSVGSGTRVVQAARLMGESRAGMALKKVNPVRLMFMADNAQNTAFRRAVMTNALKRKAFQRIRKESGLMAESIARVEQLLKLKPTDTVMRQISNVLENPHEVEALGRHVDNVLGDFVRYTARERKAFKPYVMFYGFLRYALRTAFYTLPVHHPVMASIALKLGQLHVEEVKELLGGDSAPWAYSRIFFGKDGDLRSIDLNRINPVTSPLTDVVTEGPKALGGLVSPMAQAAFDQIAGGVIYEGGRGFKVGGSAEENRNPSLTDRGRIVLEQVLSSAFPYRAAEVLTQSAGRQGDDSLLFDERPIEYVSPKARQRNQQVIDASGDPRRRLLQQIFPLFVPKPDQRTADFVREQAGGSSSSAPSAPVSGIDAEIRRVQQSLAAAAARRPSAIDDEIRRVQAQLAARR